MVAELRKSAGKICVECGCRFQDGFSSDDGQMNLCVKCFFSGRMLKGEIEHLRKEKGPNREV